MNIYIIVHEYIELLCAILRWVGKYLYSVTSTNIYLYEKRPKDIDNIDLLIIMSGPQSPHTTFEECNYFDIKVEKTFIKKAIQVKNAVLGIYLGALLIGESLSAHVEKRTEKEIRKYPIFFTEDDIEKKESKFKKFAKKLYGGHWHNYISGLTINGKIIAFIEGCPRKTVEDSNLVYSFQCHLKLTKKDVELLIENSEKELLLNAKNKFVQSLEILLSQSFRKMNEKLFFYF